MLQVKAVAHIMWKWPFDDSAFKCRSLPNNGLRLGQKQGELQYLSRLYVYVLGEGLLTLHKREWEGVEARHGTCCRRHDLCLSSGRPCKPPSPLWLDRGSLSLEKRREERWWHKLLLLRGAPVTTNRLSVGSVTTHCHPKMWCFKTTQTDVNRCVMLAQNIKHGSMLQPVILKLFCFRTQICVQPDTFQNVYKRKTKMSFKLKSDIY